MMELNVRYDISTPQAGKRTNGPKWVSNTDCQKKQMLPRSVSDATLPAAKRGKGRNLRFTCRDYFAAEWLFAAFFCVIVAFFGLFCLYLLDRRKMAHYVDGTTYGKVDAPRPDCIVCSFARHGLLGTLNGRILNGFYSFRGPGCSFYPKIAIGSILLFFYFGPSGGSCQPWEAIQFLWSIAFVICAEGRKPFWFKQVTECFM
jgi:hypothetical protein